MNRFDQAIRSSKPAVVRRALFDLAKALPHFTAPQAAAALYDALYLPQGPARDTEWVEGVFALGLDLQVVQDTLRIHADSGRPGVLRGEGSPKSRILADTLLKRAARQG